MLGAKLVKQLQKTTPQKSSMSSYIISFLAIKKRHEWCDDNNATLFRFLKYSWMFALWPNVIAGLTYLLKQNYN